MTSSNPSNNEPTRDEVRELLSELLAGNITREQAHDWAAPWVSGEAGDVQDELVWDAIDLLYLADSGHPEKDDYLYFPIDFQTWLDEFDAQREQEE